ncbi:metallophosphoesterase family protein [Deinococcus hohokamensis]|uniref:Metallophosphoesterase family protein n=1 Tax=Deinococcus hohokamensis TaxID=309883 RepID=A0ABV9IAS1_9DEIO
MRVAIFGDIHGNLPALTAALSDLRAQAPDALVCLGDVAMDGPWPGECVDRVAALGCPVVRGNADRMMLEPPAAFRARGFPDEQALHDISEWSKTQLSTAQRALVAAYAPLVSLPDLLCFHGSPARDNEELGPATPLARWTTLRHAYGAQAVWAGGHTHRAGHLPQVDWGYFNPGSVGLPFEQRGERFVNLARAEYLLLDWGPGGWQPTFRRVPYALHDLQRGILASDMPHARWLAAEWACGT